MGKESFFPNIINTILRKLFEVEESQNFDLGNPQKFLIVRQHNQLGDLLAGVSLFRAIKETYPESHITLIVSPVNLPGLVKNKFIDRLVVFNKKRLYNPYYFYKFLKLLKEGYDIAIVPVVVSISFTSNFIAGLSNAKIKIGAKKLDGKINKSAYFFHRRVVLDWRMHPDSNVSERSLDIVRPFGINTNNYRSEISFDEADIGSAKKYLKEIKYRPGNPLIGLHVGAGKPPNRWSLIKFVTLMKRLREDYRAEYYLTGSKSDKEEINYILKNYDAKAHTFINRTIPEVAALISLSDLFIANDTGIMHVAGTTSTPQVSIFGPTNPFCWAPIGSNKIFVRRSELIDDVTVQDVYDICELLLATNKKLVNPNG
jgi:ADP-heptose:LPS heptosyltransferase